MLADTLKKLISFRTVTGDFDAVRSAYEWVRGELSSLPVHICEHEYEGFPALVVTTQKTKSPKLWLVGHMDVVAGSDNVYEPVERDGNLFGRGAYDMKFAIACYIELFKQLGDSLKDFNIGIMLTADEEQGGFDGVKQLIEKDGYHGEVAFLPDGGGPWKFEEYAKGKWEVCVVAEGVAAHGSRPWEGKSAVHELCGFIAKATEALRVFEERTNDGSHWHLTMHAGTITGGHAHNQIADHAEARLDIRFGTKEEGEEAACLLESLRCAFPSITLTSISHDLPYGVSKDNTYAKCFADIAHERYGIECGWHRAHGASDARYFAQVNIPVLLITPIGGAAHSEEEWIDLADLNRYSEVMKAFVNDVAKV